jgi:8-amino-7-oxononanoate synthase
MQQIVETLEQIKDAGLFREFKWLDAPQAAQTVVDGREVLLLSSNSYLGLCDDERLKKAAVRAIEKYGVGSGGARLTSGSYVLHQQLERELAELKHAEACLVFNTGYMANLGTIAALADTDWVIFCDRLNHASIVDGCRLSKAKLVVYKHADALDLERKLKRYAGKWNLVATDGVFSMDGDIAPLDRIAEIAHRHGALLMVDDAHATGVLGPHGAGTSDYFGLEPDAVDIQMGTLSKALASEGGYVAGSRTLVDYLRHRARSFVYSTALAPQTIAVALEALSIIRSDAAARETLRSNSVWFRDQLRVAGFQVPDGITPIIPVLIGSADATVFFSKRLLDAGLFIPAIRPPTVHEGTSRLRISLMATHSRAMLQHAVDSLVVIGRGLNLIPTKAVSVR